MALRILKTLGVCLIAGHGLAAQAATAASGTASISDFSYRLVDLDPSDGMDPSITSVKLRGDTASSLHLATGESYFISTGVAEHRYKGADIPGLLFNLGTGSVTTREGLSVVKDSNGNVTSSVSASALDVSKRVTAEGLKTHTSFDGAVYYNNAVAYSEYDDYFLLSPKTALVLEGRMTGTGSADARTLIGTHASTSVDTLKAGLSLSTMSNVSLSVIRTDASGSFIYDDAYASMWEQISAGNTLFYDGLIAEGGPDSTAKSFDKAFSLEFVNAGSEAMFGIVRFSVSANTELRYIDPERAAAYVQSIPEPSTLALFVLGIGTLWTAASRRQPR